MINDDPYVDPNTGILKNKLGLLDTATLDRLEREFVTQRIVQGPPAGNFDLDHLKAIHRHMFQDVYAWAGEVRTVELSKGNDTFLHRGRIEVGMNDVHDRLKVQNYLRGIGRDDFAKAAGVIIGDVNYIHPFREGNGRTQLQYLKQLAERAGHAVNLAKLKGLRWIEASRAANGGDYVPMSEAIGKALDPTAAKSRLDRGLER